MLTTCKAPWEYGPLSVSADGRYFTNNDHPFFWLGDTAWSIFRCLNDENAYIYLKNRAEKKFSVIQCVLVNHHSFAKIKKKHLGLPDPSESPDILASISEDNEAYWKHVDDVMDMAEKLNLYLAVLPVWGSIARDGILNMGNVQAYADFIIKRYGSRPNIIWVMGGDIRGDGSFELWNTFARILKQRCPDKLVGYHPFGRTSSSYWFSEAEWLDFNMFQSGHRRYDQTNLYSWDDAAKQEPWHGEDNWRYVEHDLALEKVRPVLDAEPSYEQIPQGLHNASEPRWQDYHIRRYGYWSVMAGAAGHTYGHNAVFQFFGSVYAPPGCGVAETWDIAIHHPGASQMQIMRELMEEIKWYECAPMDVMFGKGEKQGYITTFGNDKNMLVYDYSGRLFAVEAEGYGKADAYWIDPASGVRSYLGCFDLAQGKVFTPPTKPVGHNDWLLLLKKV